MVSCVLMILFPGSLFAADSNAAMLHTNGPAWINGTHVPRPSSAIFSGDLLQTRRDSVANINEAGAAITILSDSLIKFEVSSLRIEHGGLSIATSKSVGATAGDVRVVPASSAWTEFDVTDVDGTVWIAARKGDLTVSDSDGQNSVTLPQGQQTTRDESSNNSDQDDQKRKKKKTKMAGAAPAAAQGGLLNSPIAIAVGAGAIAGVTAWVLLQSDKPASPAVP